jgi:hypothetical protein
MERRVSMSDLYQTSADLRASVADLARQERPGAALTLTRSATLAITTAATTITWKTEIRNQGFTWATTDITIPTAGYYVLNLSYTATVHTAFMRLIVNGTTTGFFSSSSLSSSTHAFTVVRYFATSDIVRTQVLPSVNVTIAVNAEGATGESPILHIAQLTGVI